MAVCNKKHITPNDLKGMTLKQVWEKSLFDPVAVRRYVIFQEYQRLLRRGMRKNVAIQILVETIWIDIDGSSIVLTRSAIERAIYHC